MTAHNVFTEIDARSYAAIVKNGYLSEVLLALLVDPLEAADVAESIKIAMETAIELRINGRVFEAPIGLSDFQILPSKDAFEKLRITLSQWVMTTEQAYAALILLTMWDRRFGVWIACAVAADSLRFVPYGDLRPLLAIETAEDWVRGKVTAAQAAAAANVAANAGFTKAAANSATLAAAYVADAAARDASYASTVESYTSHAVLEVAAAYASASGSTAEAAWTSVRDAELVRLREVVANACLTFPG